MICDDEYNDLNLHLIYDNIVYLVLVLTSTEMANYLGARHHHAKALCMITGITGREYIPGFHRTFLITRMTGALTHDLIILENVYKFIYVYQEKSIYCCDPLKSLFSCFIIIVSSDEIVQSEF